MKLKKVGYYKIYRGDMMKRELHYNERKTLASAVY
jgi:hypothetical protein